MHRWFHARPRGWSGGPGSCAVWRRSLQLLVVVVVVLVLVLLLYKHVGIYCRISVLVSRREDEGGDENEEDDEEDEAEENEGEDEAGEVLWGALL